MSKHLSSLKLQIRAPDIHLKQSKLTVPQTGYLILFNIILKNIIMKTIMTTNNRIHFGFISRLSLLSFTFLFVLSSFFGSPLLAQSSTIVTDEAQFLSLTQSPEMESYEGTTLPIDFTIELADEREPLPSDRVWEFPAPPAEGPACVEDGTQVLLFTNMVKLTFDAPLSAFATYIIDLGDYGANALEVKTNTGETWIAYPDDSYCTRIFTGIVACQPFTEITLEALPVPYGSEDGIYIDKTFYTYSEDSDCDGVNNDCDVCPDGDDSVDENEDGIPDCSQLLAYGDYSNAWKCGNNKINICHNGNTLCVNKNALPAHFNNHGDAVGPCTSCGGQGMIAPPQGNTATYQRSDDYLEVELFPNPATSEVSIHLHGLEEGEGVLRIFDQLGREMLQQNLEEGTHELKLELPKSQFVNGVYFVSIFTEKELISKRLLINR